MPTCLEKSFAAFVRERTYLKNVSPRTVQWYGECLSWLKKHPLTAEGIKDMVLGMREAGLKATSVNSRTRAANAYFRWAKLDLHADRKSIDGVGEVSRGRVRDGAVPDAHVAGLPREHIAFDLDREVARHDAVRDDLEVPAALL